jgi:hypothetical protein
MEKTKKCSCGFWVSFDDPYCPNCGELLHSKPYENEYIFHPVSEIRWLKSLLRFLGFVLGAIFGINSTYYDVLSKYISKILDLIKVSASNQEIISKIFIGLIFGIIGYFVASIIYFIIFKIINFMKKSSVDSKNKIIKAKNKKIERKKNKIERKRDRESYLKKTIQHIQRQLNELKTKERIVNRNIQLIMEEGNPDHLQDTLKSLNDQTKLIENYYKIYKTKLWEIALVRWFNRFAPFIDNWENLSCREECEQKLKELRSIRRSGETKLNQWKTQPELAAQKHGKACIKRLEKGLKICQILYHDLLAKDTAFTTQNQIAKTSANVTKSLETMEKMLTFSDAKKFLVDFSNFDKEMQEKLA